MGYIRNHCMVVSGYGDEIKAAHAKITALCAQRVTEGYQAYAGLVSPLLPHVANGCHSFMVGVDGSKEGWEPSNIMNEVRGEFVAYLKGTGLDWALMLLGGDGGNFYVEDSPAGEQET